MDKTYYAINENTARIAKEVNSFSSYKENEATNEYKATVDKVWAIVEEVAEKKPQYLDKAQYMADRFAKKYANYLNDYYRNEASCPSVLICGPANFPTKKKDRQNSRRETLNGVYKYLMAYVDKIENLITCNQPILSSDEDAIERLQDKINDLTEDQERMKRINAYYRKNNTCVGCEDLTEENARKIDEFIEDKYSWCKVPYGSYTLQNNNANIKRLKDRLESLTAIKEKGTTERENDLFKVVENTELMRLQLIFDGKPDEETRNILKSNGFKWSPKNMAWQRQLTDNAKYSLARVEKALLAQ